jgi:thiamine pyrophosphate-dependent acetolactate synthase large subunit-like protein
VIWSQAWNEMREFVEKAGIPFYTTPQGRGVVPDDHPYSYLTMRSTAFRDADLIIVLGTRMNYIIGHAAPPRFGANAKIARIEIDAEELGMSARNVDIPIVGDCKSVLQQLIDALPAKTADKFTGWRKTLADGEAAKRSGPGGNYPTDGDIHPIRLLEEVKNFMDRDAILVVDGQETLNFGRQTMPTFEPGTGSIPARSARWASACRSRSAPRWRSRGRRSSAATATARSASTRWSSTPRSGTRSRSSW